MTEIRLSPCGKIAQIGNWRASIRSLNPIALQIGYTVGTCENGVIEIADWRIKASLEGDDVVLQLPRSLVPHVESYAVA